MPRSLSALALCLAGCTVVFDIPQREVDPTFSPNAAGAAGQGGGQAGAAGDAAGSAGTGETAGSAGSAGGSGGAGQGGAGSAGAGNGGSGGSEQPKVPTCKEYCDTVDQACIGSKMVFSSYNDCLTYCDRIPPGTPEDKGNNTLSCRYKEALKAQKNPTEAATYCPAAGPPGALNADSSTCGSLCENFCYLVLEGDVDEATKARKPICPGLYADKNACLTDCSSYGDAGTYNTSITKGKTSQCLLYHVMAAMTGSPIIHCEHITPTMGMYQCKD